MGVSSLHSSTHHTIYWLSQVTPEMSSATHTLDDIEKNSERPTKRARVDAEANEMNLSDSEEDEDTTPVARPATTRASDLYLDTVSSYYKL